MDFIVRPWTFRPNAKPLHHQAELDPFGRLSFGLISTILFDASGAVYDKVLTSRRFALGYPFGSATPGVGSFLDGGGNTWTVTSGGQMQENGSNPAFSANVAIGCYIGGVVYQINRFQQNYRWNASTSQWIATNAIDPRFGHGLVAYHDSQAGGTINPGGGGYLTMTAGAATPDAWTVSVRVFFNGANQAVSTIFLTDGSGNNYFYLQGTNGGTPGALSLNGLTAAVSAWRANSFSGWHRITVTASAATGTATFYFDGISQGTASITNATTQFASVLGDSTAQFANSQPLADIFVWNRALDAADVLAHAKNPYSSVLRPRFARRDQSGVATKRMLGLTLQGVGP